MLKGIYHSLTFRLGLFGVLTVAGTYFAMTRQWEWFILVFIGWLYSIRMMSQLYKRNAQKVAFMFDAIDNSDYAFQYATRGRSSNDKLVSESLNRITQILFQAKAEAVQKEKYYELIMNSVNTGIIVLDDIGNIYQTNNEALRLLGLSVFTHVKQLARIDEKLQTTIANILPGDKHQISFVNERGTVNLSIHEDADSEIRNGLEVISTTGKSLISFVESYRKFTHIPTPEPSLFYVQKFAERMTNLARHHNNFPNITININIEPADLIVYADEKLITQVVLNLLKNAMQAIGSEQPDGLIELKAYCNPDESVIIEVSNNGPTIPPEEAEHIFVPFFTTKEGGSGIGLSISRQIMRLSGGSIALKSNPTINKTSFILTFP